MLTFVAAAVLAVLLLVTSDSVVRILFERGAFGHQDTLEVSHIQKLLLIQIPFHVSGLVFVRLLSSLQHNHTLLFIGLIALVANVVGNYMLMQILSTAGIALSTSLALAISFALLAWAGVRAMRRLAAPVA